MRSEDLRFGRVYKDLVSGWEGTMTARYEYANGCVRVELSSADKDGYPKGHVFDVEQIALVGPGAMPERTPSALALVDQPQETPRRRRWRSRNSEPGLLRRTGGPRSNEPVER